MAFSIAEFHSRLNQYGGLAKSNTFEAVVFPPAAVGNDMPGEDLRFFCQSVDIPGIELTTAEYHYQGYGRPEKRITNVEFQNFSAIFRIDYNHRVKQLFDRWMFLAINYDNRTVDGERNGKLPYEIEYKANVVGTVEVGVFGTNAPRVNYIYKFEEAYPTSVGNIQMAWADNNSFLVLPVSFTYTSYIPSEI